MRFDIDRLFAFALVVGLGVAFYGWFVGVAGAKEILIYILGAVTGAVKNMLAGSPPDKICAEAPANYSIKATIEVQEK